jgi:D-alanyl-D-alanine carboxypeptidase
MMSSGIMRFHRRAALRQFGTVAAGAGAIGLGITPGAPARMAAQEASPEPDVDSTSELTAAIEQRMAELIIPGAVVLIRSPKMAYARAFGTRQIGEDDLVTVDDHFRIGSNTKTMTGTVVLQLVDEGRLALTDPVAAFRDDVPNGNAITIAQILDMSSGLFNYSVLPELNQAMDDEPERVWEPEELLALGFAEEPYFAPGEGFHYSNTNTVLAGVIAEQITGQPLAKLFRERLFDPLALSRTSLPAIDDASIPEPHAHGYMYGTNMSTIQTTALSAEDQEAAAAGSLLPNDRTFDNPSWGWAAGAAISTAPDLATYVEALVGGTFLSGSLQEQRLNSLAPVTSGANSAQYGLALAQFGPMIGHDGSLPGFQSFMGHDPQERATLIVLTNLQSAPDSTMTANALAMAAMAAMYP